MATPHIPRLSETAPFSRKPRGGKGLKKTRVRGMKRPRKRAG